MAPASYPPVVFKKCRLRRVLIDRGVTDPQAWLIELLGISHITAQRILRGCDLRFGRAVKIAEKLDLDINHLWGI